MPFRTPGEALQQMLADQLFESRGWTALQDVFDRVDRGSDYTSFFRQIAATATVGRIVALGCHVAKDHHIDSELYAHEFGLGLRRLLGFPDPDFKTRLERHSRDAVRGATSTIPEGVRNALKREARAKNAGCYLCGVTLKYKDNGKKSGDSFSLDHVWPRSYGGTSEPENLLACCDHCNNSKKKGYANWAMPAVQSIVFGCSVGHESLSKLDGCLRFALHHFRAESLAKHNNVSLKTAFLRLGPWSAFNPVQEKLPLDFFSLVSSL